MQSPAPKSLSRLDILRVAALVGILYFAQDFFVPLVLAALVSFLLDPLNRWLQRRGLNHVLSVLVTTGFTFLLLGVLIYVVSVQVLDLAHKLPEYKSNLVTKANALRMQDDGPIGRAIGTLKEVASSIDEKKGPVKPTDGSTPSTGEETKEPTNEEKLPVAVEVIPSTSQTVAAAKSVVGPILSPIGSAALVLLIAVFMMIGRDDLRDRVVHLVGRGRLRLTTHALDEASRRVSRYLFAQLIVNVTYGIPVGIGLYFIGIPNAMLWGMLAIVLRFLPYIGPWIAAAFPVALSIAVSSSWTAFLLTIGLFVVMELLSNNVVEPWLYGAKTGLSPFAVVVSAVFWTWLWGIPGLILATPLTVCLVVMGKHVPHLRVLDLLFGDRPPITEAERLYHRLLSRDEDEALEILQESAKTESNLKAFDEVALRTVRLIETDFGDGLLLEIKRDEALLHLREIVAEMGDARALPPGVDPAVLCIPASNLADEIAAEMLMEGLRIHGIPVECLSCSLTSGEAVTKAAELKPKVICISVMTTDSAVAASFICKRARAALPQTRVMVGMWQDEDAAFHRRCARLETCGANRVLPTIERMVAAVLEIIPVENQERTEQELAKREEGQPAEAKG